MAGNIGDSFLSRLTGRKAGRQEGATVPDPVTPAQVANYFARVLERGRLEEVTFKDEVFVSVPREALAGGSLVPEEAAKLFAAHDARHGRRSATPRVASTDADEPAADDTLQVVVSLVSLAQQGGHSGLLLLGAALHRDGRLDPVIETASSPWIPAEHLESPSVSSREVMVGAQSRFFEYSRTRLGAEASQTETFSEAMDLAMGIFEDVAGCSVEQFVQQPADGKVQHELCHVRELDRINAVGGLLEVYDHVDRKGTPALFERVATGWTAGRVPEATIHDGTGLREAAQRSCGSMSDGFPLTDSQRRAVHAFLASEEGDVTAVSGPPGTGKTTMLQAIVANLLTQRALDREDPPLVVGTSTNNQAVTNIISSFASVAKDEPGSLDLRWLPQEVDGVASKDRPLQSLAVYCPAKSKLREARSKYLVEQPGKTETYTGYSSKGYLDGARDVFAVRAHAHFGFMDELPRMQDAVHAALVEVDTLRRRLLKAMGEQGPSPSYVGVCAQTLACEALRDIEGLDELAFCRTLVELDQKLDQTLRYAEFWLAVHYFEAQWLQLGETVIPVDDRYKTTQDVMQRYWHQAPALTPCFVMTAYQVPKYFRLYSKQGEPSRFDTGRIDLLIVDEAGQVDTPIGLPAFALARRAVVVGDEKQLSPVWSLDEETDREVAQSVGITDDQWARDLQPRGLTCSAPSSLMRAASHASRWSYGNNLPGLFLSEHFRCHPGIIGFCNELLYDGLLQPSRPAKSLELDDLTAAFLFAEVAGSQDARKGSSRTNQVEAQAIAAWIVDNYSFFLGRYNDAQEDPNKKVSEDALIGVVTPFSAQASVIKAELKRAVLGADPSARLPEHLWEKITVGTAHKLQGAERPVVLFSTVYGGNSPTAPFIDGNLELMNVAVSRAKDLFIVFASETRWGNGKVFTLMTQYATRSSAVFGCPAQEEPGPGEEEQFVAPVAFPGADHLADASVDEPEAENGHPVAEPRRAQPCPPVTVSTLIRQWGAAGELAASDTGLKAADLNVRLQAAGVLEGEPGHWHPSVLAALLGTVAETRSTVRGDSYETIEYTARMQGLLLDLYREGLL